MRDRFELTHTVAFDTREALVAWVLPGTVASLPGYPDAEANLWTDREGRLFAEFRCDGYEYHYEISKANGTPITHALQNDVCEFLQERLVTWVIEGVDDDVLNM